jgi:hypothetical protein
LWCDTAWYFAAALKASAGEWPQAFIHGVETMAPTPSAQIYLMQTKKGRHDGSGAIRVGEWFDDCDCFKPTTGVIPV